jgi:hypothetical protein
MDATVTDVPPPGESHLNAAPEVVRADPELIAVISRKRLLPKPPIPGDAAGVMLTVPAVVAAKLPILTGPVAITYSLQITPMSSAGAVLVVPAVTMNTQSLLRAVVGIATEGFPPASATTPAAVSGRNVMAALI